MQFAPLGPRTADLTGIEFERLLVIGYAGKYSWWCKCVCGNCVKVATSNLVNHLTRSCGCLHKERVTVHGNTSHSEYNTWRGLVARCTDSSNPAYASYGGRGIKVYPPWLENARSFLTWIDENLGPRPKGYTLDRINNNGHYEPGNLRWATWSQQNKNKRKSKA